MRRQYFSEANCFTMTLLKPRANKIPISKSKFGQMISDDTYFLSYWMTMAQFEKMKSRTVIFQNLDLLRSQSKLHFETIMSG